MWTNKVTSIRQLSRDFYNGDISQEEYRRQRTLKLELISAGENPYGNEEKTRPRNTVTQDTGDAPIPNQVSIIDQIKNMEWMEKVPYGRKVIPAVAGVIALVIIVGIFWPDSETQKPVVKTDSVSKVQVSTSDSDSTQNTVESFLEKDDWSIASIADFAKAWDALSEQEREQARNANWFRPLKDGLRSRILEQQALQDSDINEAVKMQSEQEVLLESFAGHLGLRK